MNSAHLLAIAALFAVSLLAGCINKSNSQVDDSQAEFTCENTDVDVQSRGYVLLMGYGDHNKFGWDVEKYYMEKDPKARFALIYDQDERRHLPDISEKFLADLKSELRRQPVDELVIFGASAGGVTASYSISKLNFSGPIAVHTLSSPLNGYGFPKAVLGNRTGFMLDIASGLPEYEKPPANVKVYHHKTIRDTILVDHYCKGIELLCNALEIQNNNVPGSKEFFYANYDHNPLMKVVIPKVLKCYNPNLEIEIPQELSDGFGGLCSGKENCKLFCQNNRGLCNNYCEENPSNSLCQNAEVFDRQNVQRVQSSTSATNLTNNTANVIPNNQNNGSTLNSPAPQVDVNSPPVLQNLGVNIEPWDKSTNRAGDLLFDQRIYTNSDGTNDRTFIDFGSSDGRPSESKNIEYWFFVPLGTKLRAPVSGVAQVSYLNHTDDWVVHLSAGERAQWIVSFEHVVNLNVKNGDVVNAGDIVAEAAPRSTYNGEIAMVELAIWNAGQHIVKHCPYNFLNNSLKPAYTQKLNQLAYEWESFIGRDAYKQENWVAPGCWVNSIQEN